MRKSLSPRIRKAVLIYDNQCEIHKGKKFINWTSSVKDTVKRMKI